MTSPTERFTARAGDYAKFRPRYPAVLFSWLTDNGVLTPSSTVADIGSGTGIFTRQISAFAGHVYAVEPNRAMREHSLREFRDTPGVTVVDGTAESTTLAAHSIDLVTAAQAFHWFDWDRARTEFGRILREGGRVLLVWNERLTTGSRFLEGYEELLVRHAVDYTTVDHRNVTPAVIGEFFSPGPVTAMEFPFEERLDEDSARGRLLSASYIPRPGTAGFDLLMREFGKLFGSCSDDGIVVMRYHTKLYVGTLPPATFA